MSRTEKTIKYLITWIVLNQSLSLWQKQGLKLAHLARKKERKLWTLLPPKYVILISNASKVRTSLKINQKSLYLASFSSIKKTAKNRQQIVVKWSAHELRRESRILGISYRLKKSSRINREPNRIKIAIKRK